MSQSENKYIAQKELFKMIQEEKELVKKEMILREELKYIEKKLAELNEVHTGGAMAPGTDGVHAGQQKAVFTKKGTHLIETDEDEIDDAPNADTDDMDVDTDTVNVGAEDLSGDDAGMDMDMDGIDANADAEAGNISKEEVKNAIAALGASLGLDGMVDFNTQEDEMGGEIDGGIEGEEGGLDVDVEMGAEDAGGAPEGGEGDAPTDDVVTSDEETVDECGDDKMAEQQQPINENVTPGVAKASQEKNRWNFLINYRNG